MTRSVIAEKVELGLRQADPDNGTVVGLEYWRATQAARRATADAPGRRWAPRETSDRALR